MTACVFSAFTMQPVRKPVDGKTLFEKNCQKCHGAKGTKGFFGAANLQKSVMTEEAIVDRIQNGKKFMPSFKNKLSPDEIKELAGYVKALRGGH
jgi:mono/diheme cytochrome c family protein